MSKVQSITHYPLLRYMPVRFSCQGAPDHRMVYTAIDSPRSSVEMAVTEAVGVASTEGVLRVSTTGVGVAISSAGMEGVVSGSATGAEERAEVRAAPQTWLTPV